MPEVESSGPLQSLRRTVIFSMNYWWIYVNLCKLYASISFFFSFFSLPLFANPMKDTETDIIVAALPTSINWTKRTRHRSRYPKQSHSSFHRSHHHLLAPLLLHQLLWHESARNRGYPKVRTLLLVCLWCLCFCDYHGCVSICIPTPIACPTVFLHEDSNANGLVFLQR